MKNYFVHILITSLLLFISCDKQQEIIMHSAISDIASFDGNPRAKDVIIHVQGGPSITLEQQDIKDRITASKTEHVLHVNVHQVQTLDATRFTGTTISFEQTPDFHKKNVAMLKKVVDYFKKQDKNVYLVGVSFGGFLIQEFIATHGIIADGYGIFVARLDLEEQTWKSFSKGIYKRYYYNDKGEFTIEKEKNPPPFTNKTVRENMAILASGLGKNRYSNKLNHLKDLSKITYFYGDKDEAVGPLSSYELAFLKNKKARVICYKGADHSIPVTKGMVRLKEIFGIA